MKQVGFSIRGTGIYRNSKLLFNNLNLEINQTTLIYSCYPCGKSTLLDNLFLLWKDPFVKITGSIDIPSNMDVEYVSMSINHIICGEEILLSLVKSEKSLIVIDNLFFINTEFLSTLIEIIRKKQQQGIVVCIFSFCIECVEYLKENLNINVLFLHKYQATKTLIKQQELVKHSNIIDILNRGSSIAVQGRIDSNLFKNQLNSYLEINSENYLVGVAEFSEVIFSLLSVKSENMSKKQYFIKIICLLKELNLSSSILRTVFCKLSFQEKILIVLIKAMLSDKNTIIISDLLDCISDVYVSIILDMFKHRPNKIYCISYKKKYLDCYFNMFCDNVFRSL